ncbi:MAG: hypothetical protein KME35_13355 [Aphanocapsa sp. GSE-SYN-MK-11-07L]|jgi:RsiW-degrading membrane proteinase PrsW (M82 family)|nr:hypothetical protein [Aphanocapsa sp. GSE-SYN-MK-11-07L]
MSTSPFSTYKEFLEAKGPIYTFANNPTMIGFFIVLTVLILLYFIYATFAPRSQSKNSQHPVALGVLLMVGLSSALASNLYNFVQKEGQPPTRRVVSQRSLEMNQPEARRFSQRRAATPYAAAQRSLNKLMKSVWKV